MIRMPLKLKLGRTSGRYELSEDIYILTIFIGEVPMAQCTLTSISTTADVFRYLGEKLNLNQTKIFGLQYQMKATDTEKRMMRWIEPDKPIRRQLERWACRRGQKWAVNLAILHACSNVFALTDYVSRSAYYTLLKWDVLRSGKFALDLDKYIILAAYQLQIELPDIKPTIEYLKTLNLLPQSMCLDPKVNNDDTYMRILNAYEKLNKQQPAYAALLYIVEIQQCEGYGEEAFCCKDGSSLEEVFLGYSLDWIFVRRPNGTAQKFRWEEVREIVANKRKLSIKYGDNLTNSVFCFEDNEMARYVATVLNWKWRHARTDAQEQRSARLSVQNLQGGVPSFNQPGSFLRRSNTNMNVIRPSSELNGSIGNGTGYINGTSAALSVVGSLNSCQFMPATPQLSATRADQSSQSTVHSIQSCTARQPINSSLSVCCRSISIGQMTPNMGTNVLGCRPSVGDKNSPPSAAFYPPGMLGNAVVLQAPPLPPPPPPIPLSHPPPLTPLLQRTSNSSQDSDWLRNEQKEVLKRMLTEKRRLNKIGSSPEINTIGKSVSGSGAKCKRHHVGGGGGAGFSLARKIFTSTPNLHSARGGQQQQHVAHSSSQALPSMPPPPIPSQHHHNPTNQNGLYPMPSPSATHRLLVNPPINTNALTSFPPEAFPSASSSAAPMMPMPLPSSSSPHILLHHHHQHPAMMMNGSVGMAAAAAAAAAPITPLPNSNVGFFNSVPNTPRMPINATTAASFFSQGQIIDENGQQQTIIYPMPPEANSLGQFQQQQGHILPSNSPPTPMPQNNNSSVTGDESRSSPKSNATSSHSSEHAHQNCPNLQPNSNGLSTTSEQPSEVMPELSVIEFSGVPAKSLKADYSVAIRPHNLSRNRGNKIYPYNENRVKLTNKKSNPDGYINASELAIPIGRHSRIRYIVSQAPIQKTIEDFWQMVWETDARLIVMLVNPHQINKDDTIPSYIPSQAKEKFTVGDFFLRLKNVSPPMQMQMFQSTTMFTLAKQGQPRRTIFHLYCADFSESGVPSSMDTFIGLIDAVASVKRHIRNEIKKEGRGPIGGTGGAGGGMAPTSVAGGTTTTTIAQNGTPTATATSGAISKSNSNTSKESRSSSDISRRERTQSVESSGWAKKLRFEQNGHSKQQQATATSSASSSSAMGNDLHHPQIGALAITTTATNIHQHQQQQEEEPMAIIQCTDGASESGLYLLAEIIIKCMEKNASFDISQLLRGLRYQRMCLVKNAQQYKFIYELVSFYERKNRLI